MDFWLLFYLLLLLLLLLVFFNCMYKIKWQRSRKVQTKIQYVNLNSHPVSAWRWESIQYAAKGSQDIFIAPRNTIGLTVWADLIITTNIEQIYTPWLFVSFFQMFGIKNIKRWDKLVWKFQRKESRNYKSFQDWVWPFYRNSDSFLLSLYMLSCWEINYLKEHSILTVELI